MSTRGTGGSRGATRSVAPPNAQWFLRLSFLFGALALLTAVLLVLRESGVDLFTVDGIAASTFVLTLSVGGESIDKSLLHLSILLHKQMVRAGLIEVSFREAIELFDPAAASS